MITLTKFYNKNLTEGETEIDTIHSVLLNDLSCLLAFLLVSSCPGEFVLGVINLYFSQWVVVINRTASWSGYQQTPLGHGMITEASKMINFMETGNRLLRIHNYNTWSKDRNCSCWLVSLMDEVIPLINFRLFTRTLIFFHCRAFMGLQGFAPFSKSRFCKAQQPIFSLCFHHQQRLGSKSSPSMSHAIDMDLDCVAIHLHGSLKILSTLSVTQVLHLRGKPHWNEPLLLWN